MLAVVAAFQLLIPILVIKAEQPVQAQAVPHQVAVAGCLIAVVLLRVPEDKLQILATHLQALVVLE